VVPSAPTCTASDGQSGLAGPCVVSGYATSVGTHTVTAVATDKAGNQASASATYTVLPLTLNGSVSADRHERRVECHQRRIHRSAEVRGFRGSTELTDTTLVAQPLTATQVACTGGAIDEVELLASGGTSLRYDAGEGRFVYNWQTPKNAGYCYVVTVRLADGTSVSANVRTK
jgi:hypothetical protein